MYDISDETDQHIFVYNFIEYVEDTEGSLDFQSIRAGKVDSLFAPSKDFTPDNYNTNSPYWFRIKIRHHSKEEKKWLLEFFDQTIDSLTAFIPHKEGHYEVIEGGEAFPFQERRIKHKNFVFPIENDHDQELTYYFRIKASHPVDAIIVIRSFDYFTFYSLNEYFLFGLFYGLIILIALYNLLLFIALRESPYLYFVLFAISIMLYFASRDGLTYQYLWPKADYWNTVAYGVFSYGVVLFGTLFAKKFLHLKFKSKRSNNVLNFLLITRSIYFVICLIWRPVWFDYIIIDTIPLVAIFIIGAQLFYRGYKPARLFTLGFGFITLGAILKILLITGIGQLGSGVVIYYSVNIGFLLQLITLSLALADKVRIIKQKKDRAVKRIVQQYDINQKLQQKVNDELEQKVKERTIEIKNKNLELESVNQKLEEQSSKIYEMNQLLDQDNWNLKKNNLFQLRQKLMNKGVSWDEFKAVFNNESSCIQYLATLKWKDAFSCKKCGHANYTEDNTYARRCTKCGYVESITSNTIFHNVKFPLMKAFYIVHLEFSGTKITNKELAETIDLRLATCSNFRTKIKNQEGVILD